MKKTTYIPTLLALLAGMTACESGDMPVQQSTDYDYFTFRASTQKMLTRANPYEDYDPQRHPDKMGVFGYYELAGYDALSATRASATPLPNPIYNNDIAQYNSASTNWEDALRKRWDDYRGAKSFDFFAYMPQYAGAKVERTATDAYTLSVPFSMPQAEPFITDTKQAPIVCALPCHKEGTTASGNEFTFERIISFQFDQTLTAYRLLFQLDRKMSAIRQFRIKEVTLSGNIATGGTICRTYSWANKDWTAGDILWTDVNKKQFAENAASIPYTDNAQQGDDNASKTVLVSSDDYAQWGSTFYVIPDAEFTPTISVKYDVVFTAEDGTTVVTRKDVTSTIELNKNNFKELATGKTAMINPVRILIQPRYLYVLADEDAYTGHLLID